MSGPETFRGMDYQVAVTMHIILGVLTGPQKDLIFKFDSLDENEEDFNIFTDDCSIYYQIKKKMEGYVWSLSGIRDIFKNFAKKNKASAQFVFISNGGANRDVKRLKTCLDEGVVPSDELLESLVDKDLSKTDLLSVLSKTTFVTLHFATSNDSDPAEMVRKELLSMLSGSNFYINGDVNGFYGELYCYIYKCCRESAEIKQSDFADHMKELGCEIVEYGHKQIPEITNFVGRDGDIENIKKKIEEKKIVLLTGLTGIGKTSLLATIAREFVSEEKLLFWFSFSACIDEEYFFVLFSSFLAQNGYYAYAERVSRSKSDEKFGILLDIVSRVELVLFVDSLNSAKESIVRSFADLVRRVNKVNCHGKLLISSTEKVLKGVEFNADDEYEYVLKGLPPREALKYFDSISAEIPPALLEEYCIAVGGHPLLLFYMKELLLSKINLGVLAETLAEIREVGIDVASEWLFDKVFSTLDGNDREMLSALSIFTYDVDASELEPIFPVGIRPQFALSGLIAKGYIVKRINSFSLHDAIAAATYNLLSVEKRDSFHEKMYLYYSARFENIYGEIESVSYEQLLRWSHHVSSITRPDVLSSELYKIKLLDEQSVDALWAIECFGYPYDFCDSSLNNSKALVESLLKFGWIKKSEGKVVGMLERDRLFELVSDNFLENAYITCRCLSENISNHLGYIPKMTENYAYEEQGLVCEWEHCIELMPVPRSTKSERQKHIDFIKEQFKKGAYADKSQDQIYFLQSIVDEGVPADAPDEKDVELIKRSCPIFGHICPGGEETARDCRSEE